jgi:hypothetical protein
LGRNRVMAKFMDVHEQAGHPADEIHEVPVEVD